MKFMGDKSYSGGFTQGEITALVLFMIPCLYVILSGVGLTHSDKQERMKNSVYES